jgi:hypothetical protein
MKQIIPLILLASPLLLAGCAPAEHGGGHGAAGLDDYSVQLYPLPAEPVAGEEATLHFVISRKDGAPVAFDIIHEKPLHVMIIRDDLQHFTHIHADEPAEAYALPYVFPAPGKYRVMAEFSEHGRTIAVPLDVVVPGEYVPVPLDVTAREQKVGEYDIILDAPAELRANEHSELSFEVLREGVPVLDLDNFLGEKMHLAVWQEGLQYFAHAHPGHGAGIPFEVEFPSAGVYKLFGQFKHKGVVQTAEFVVRVI